MLSYLFWLVLSPIESNSHVRFPPLGGGGNLKQLLNCTIRQSRAFALRELFVLGSWFLSLASSSSLNLTLAFP